MINEIPRSAEKRMPEQVSGPMLNYFVPPNAVPRPMSEPLAWCALVPSLICIAFGVFTLSAFLVVSTVEVGPIAAFWMLSGIFSVLATGPLAVFNYIRARFRRPVDATAKKYGWTIVANASIILLTIVVIVLSDRMTLGAHTHVRVTNATQTLISSVVVHFDNGDLRFGPLPPGRSEDSGLRWVNHHGGPLNITVSVGSTLRTKADRPSVGEVSIEADPFTVIVEPAELPKVGGPATHP